MTLSNNASANAAAATGFDSIQRAEHPVALINNDWAPTLAFAFSLGRQNIQLHLYGPGAGRWSRYCRRHDVCPPVELADEFLPWLQKRLRSGEITRLAPTTDLIAYYMAILRDDFPAEVRRSITPLHEIERCLIKTRFSEACAAAGQLVPLHAAPDDIEGAVAAARTLGYPLIIKPKSHLVVGSAERGRLVQDESGLRKHFRRYLVARGQSQIAAQYPELLWPLLQRYLRSAQLCVYSVSGIKDADRGILAATVTCKRQQWPPDVGVSTVQAVCDDVRILETGLATVNNLLSRGIFELELLTDAEKLLAIDLNPRAFGFMNLDMAVGNDLPWLWWQTTINSVEPTGTLGSKATLECRFVVPYYFNRVIRRILGAPDVKSQANHDFADTPWVSMVGHRRDPLPMLLANLRLLKLLPHPGGIVRPFVASAWRARNRAPQRLT
jgi:D-aspartate ligase